MQWVLSYVGQDGSNQSKKVCDHITILIGRILNQTVSRISDNQEELDDDSKFT